jgi:CBS domain-containing protein
VTDEIVNPVQQISQQNDVDSLRAIVETMPGLLPQWVNAGVEAFQIGRRLTAINDAVTCRLIELHIAKAGPAPVPFCWLGFGSQARCEQLPGADQDNGLLLSNRLAVADKPWFEELAEAISDGLNACGYIYCPGKVMATTDAWRQTLRGWHTTVDRWTRTPTPAALLQVSIGFDLRAVYGKADLCRHLQQHMLETASRNTIFLAALAANAIQVPAPLGIFRRFIVEHIGEHQNAIDLKKRGVMPIIDIVRIHALANKITAVNTDDRVRELERSKALAPGDSRKLRKALHFIMRLRIHIQARQLLAGEKTTNYCNPANLPRQTREQLRDAFTVINDAQTAVRQTFRAGMG